MDKEFSNTLGIIFVEGETGKAAHKFWSSISRLYLDDKYKVIGIPGSGRLYSDKVKKTLNQIVAEGELKYRVIFIFDKESGVKVYQTMNELNSICEELRNTGIDIRAYSTPEFSFEEMIVVSSENQLLRNSKIRDMLKMGYEKNINIEQTRTYMEALGYNWHSREQLAYAELKNIVSRKEAIITKNHIGRCWIGDKENCKRYEHGNCDIKCNKKIYELLDNTVIRASEFIERLRVIVSD